MKRIIMNSVQQSGPTIMVFVEGTILKPVSWISLYRLNTYVPIGAAVRIITEWQKQGANIIYCTSRKKRRAVYMAELLREHGFSGVSLVARDRREAYASLVEELQPDILIEDDCKSIGGAWQMCITKVNPQLKERIKSIVVPEFKGIDHLPMDLEKLASINH